MCDVLYNKRRGEGHEKHQNWRENFRISTEKRTDFAGFCQTDQFEYCFAQPVGTEYWQSYLEYFIYVGGGYGHFCIRTGGTEGGERRNDIAQRAA